MPTNILLQTLYYTANPTHQGIDLNGTGGSWTDEMTAAESHDSSDNTHSQATTYGDGVGTNGDFEFDLYASGSNLTTSTATGTISFVRVVARGQVFGTGGACTLYAFDGTSRIGSATSVPTSAYTDMSWDFATLPGTGTAWTNAAINSATRYWGISGNATFDDAYSPGHVDARFSEFRVEVWGPQTQTSTPTSVEGIASAPSPAVVAGLVTSVLASLESVASCDAAAPVIGAVQSSLQSLATLAELSYPVVLVEYGAPGVVVPAAFLVNNSGTFKSSIASSRANLNDNNDATLQSATSPLGPVTGTLSVSLTGLDATTLTGFHSIAGIKAFARVRIGTDENGALSNVRFDVSGDQAIISQPLALGLNTSGQPFTLIQTDLIAAGSGAQPFEWGDSSNPASVISQCTGWSVKADYLLTTGYSAKLEVSEAWLEIHCPTGVRSEPIVIEGMCGNFIKPLTITTGGA